MDTFAAIALSTEPPHIKILQSRPTSNASILTAPIWRQVLGVSLWNYAIILVLFIMGPLIAGLESFSYYDDKTTTIPENNACKDLTKIHDIKVSDPSLANDCKPYWGGQMKLKLFTLILVTFVFM